MTLSFFSLLILVLATINLPPSVPESHDESCLTNLYNSLEDPTGSLINWTRSTFSAPCNGVISNLQGATCDNNRIYKLTLSNLSLHGFISPYISNCNNLQTLDLSSNHLTGPIPAEIQTLINLAVLNLSSNLLLGQIPPTISQCAFLNVIDLRENQLEGPIPPQMGFLSRLTVFNVSYNRLSGPIPTSLVYLPGNKVRFNASCFEGNKGLFGYPLVGEQQHRKVPILMIVGIGLGTGLVSLALSFALVCFWLRITKEQRVVEGE